MILICISLMFDDAEHLFIVANWCLTLATPWTVACQAPLSVEFSRKEYWSELPFPPPGDPPDPGTKPVSPALLGIFFTTVPPGKPKAYFCNTVRHYRHCMPG